MTTPAPDAVGDLDCSARGCRQDATWGVLWNNPRIHAPERRKVWLACDDHREHLEEYLRVRDFLRDTVPVEVLPRLELGERPVNPMAAAWGQPQAGAPGAAERPSAPGPTRTEGAGRAVEHVSAPRPAATDGAFRTAASTSPQGPAGSEGAAPSDRSGSR